MFESDEASEAEPRLAARTASMRLEAAIDEVRSKFGRFLIAATGIDEFEDRWHLSKNDIRASVEPMVFPNTGTMRRIQNAMKSDWKLAHPYKLAIDHDDAGFGSMPEGDGPPKNLHLDKTYHPSSGNLIPSPDFEGWKNSVDQGGPEKVEANDFTPGGDSGSDKHARRRQAIFQTFPNEDAYQRSIEDHQDAERARNAPPQDPIKFSDEDVAYLKGLGQTPAQGGGAFPDWESYHNHHGASRKIDVEAAKMVADIYTDFAQSNGLRVASLDTLDHYASTGIAEADYRMLESMILRTAEACEDDDEKEESDESDSESDSSDSESDSEAPKASESDDDDDSDSEDEEYDFGGSDDSEGDSDSDDDSDDEEYDFGGGDDSGGEDQGGGQSYTVPDQAPELDPQMLNEIPHDNPQGAAPVPPNVIDSLLGLPEGTIEQLLLEEVEQGQGGAPEQGGGDPGFGGDQGGFGGPDQGAPQGGGDDFLGGGGDDAEQEPPRVARRRQAKDYGRKCSECKSNNTDYSSSTNDYDCYDCGATFKPYSNPKKSPEKESRLRQAIKDTRGRDQSRGWAIDQLDDPSAKDLSDEELQNRLHEDMGKDPEYWNEKESRRRTALEEGETPTLGPLQGPMDLGYGDADFPESLRPQSEDDLDMPMVDKLTQQYHDDPFRKHGPELDPAAGHAGFGEFSHFGPDSWDYDAINRMTDARQEHERGRTSRRSARQFWAAPDESEGDLMGRQQRQQRDAIDTKFGPAPQAKPNIQELYARAQGGDREAYSTLKGLYQQRGWTAARRFWAADGDQEPQEDPSGGEQPPQGDPSQGGGDPAAMGGGQPMMPPPGSQSVAPPAPAQPLENQPAEDALLDTANQIINRDDGAGAAPPGAARVGGRRQRHQPARRAAAARPQRVLGRGRGRRARGHRDAGASRVRRGVDGRAHAGVRRAAGHPPHS
jgi:hypothetical protein